MGATDLNGVSQSPIGPTGPLAVSFRNLTQFAPREGAGPRMREVAHEKEQMLERFRAVAGFRSKDHGRGQNPTLGSKSWFWLGFSLGCATGRL
jgi:hypothetical protein